MTEPLPAEPSGASAPDGTWETARSLMLRYQVADPAVVRATYRHDAPLAGRDMLLQSASQGFASTSEYGWARSMTRHAKSTNDRRASSAGTTAPWKGTSNRAKCTTKSGNGSTPATSTSAYTHTRARPGAARSCYARVSAS